MPDEKRKACPTSDRLLAWSQGRVSAEEQDRIAAHVVRCAACDAVLERLDGADDSVVRDLRRDDVARPADSDLERVLRQAEALRGSGPDEAPRGDGRLPNRLGRIRLEKCIGRGGMGDVYKGWHERFKRTVAVKVLSKKYRGRDAAARFQREIVATGRSMHENLVLGLDADQEGDHQYLVMEFVDGESFEALVRRRGPLPAAEVCDLIRQAARGLEHAHANGLVHRDVKPANLMQAKSGTVKVLDLGLARLVDDEPALQDTTPPGDTVDGSGAAKPLTCATGMMGTYGYVAPEQIRDARDADARSDVYSLGCTSAVRL